MIKLVNRPPKDMSNEYASSFGMYHLCGFPSLHVLSFSFPQNFPFIVFIYLSATPFFPLWYWQSTVLSLISYPLFVFAHCTWKIFPFRRFYLSFSFLSYAWILYLQLSCVYHASTPFLSFLCWWTGCHTFPTKLHLKLFKTFPWIFPSSSFDGVLMIPGL